MNSASQTVASPKKKFNYYLQRFKTPEQRFWEKVNKNGKMHPYNPELGRCWEWTDTKYGIGYGRLETKGKRTTAHHISYKMHKGEIEAGKLVLHNCDNPPCVNPAHLKLGTPLDNMRDKVIRGRHNAAKGESHYAAKLTEAQVIEMRRLHESGISEVAIRKMFGVGQACVNGILLRKRWKHI